MASRWEGVRLPQASGKSPDFPGSSPKLHRKFFGDFPGILSLWNLTPIHRFPGSFPDFPRSSPDFPGSFLDFPGGQPLSLGSLTLSPDSQKTFSEGPRPSFTECLALFQGSLLFSERAKGAEKASCGETVVQKGGFGESVSSLPP